MKWICEADLTKRAALDALVIPFWEGASETSFLPLKSILHTKDFKGHPGEVLLFYTDEIPEKRVLLLGLGKEDQATEEGFRRSYAAAAKALQRTKAKSCHVLLPKRLPISREDALRGACEGILLANYAFTKLKGKGFHDSSSLLQTVGWIGLSSAEKTFLDRQLGIFQGVYFTRDLVNDNADTVTPEFLAKTARSLEKLSRKIDVTTHDKEWLEKEGMGLILAVSRGSNIDPYLLEISYQGNPSSKETIVLVGKGVTYDTGGLSLKPSDSMLTMKCDMAGSAAVLGTMRALAELDLNVNVIGLIPTVENSIDAKSYKVGDVYSSYSGKTVEVCNTDAEGRLILADALTYAVKNLKASTIIDLATLTGSVVLALGHRMAGFWANDEDLAVDLQKASETSSDLLWRLPLCKDYKESMKSFVADMKNIGGREAGSITAALFLSEFVENTKWAHIDIAGTAFWDRPKEYHPTQGTGYGVRLLIEYIAARYKK